MDESTKKPRTEKQKAATSKMLATLKEKREKVAVEKQDQEDDKVIARVVERKTKTKLISSSKDVIPDVVKEVVAPAKVDVVSPEKPKSEISELSEMFKGFMSAQQRPVSAPTVKKSRKTVPRVYKSESESEEDDPPARKVAAALQGYDLLNNMFFPGR